MRGFKIITIMGILIGFLLSDLGCIILTSMTSMCGIGFHLGDTDITHRIIIQVSIILGAITTVFIIGMTHITLLTTGDTGYNPYYYYSAPMRNYRKIEANSVYRGQNLHRNNSSNWNSARYINRPTIMDLTELPIGKSQQ